MIQRQALRLLSAVLVVALAAALVSCGDYRPNPSAEPPRHVVLVSIDTLIPEALRAFRAEAPEHPALDQFSRGARRYVDALSTAPWTLPAHASLFTGLQPLRHGAIARGTRLRSSVRTLAEVLADAGFDTAAFVDGGFLDATYGFDRGFDRYVQRRPEVRRSPETFASARAFLAEASPADRRLFLFLHTYLVHDYFHGHPWIVDASGEALERKAAAERQEQDLRCLRLEQECDAQTWERLERWYADEVAVLDAEFGRLQEAVEAALGDSVLWIVLSDHGEGFAPERRRVHHGGRLHADLLRIPLMIAGPGVKAGLDASPVSLVDIAPSVAELLEVPWAASDGVSLVPTLSGETALPRSRSRFGSEFFYSWEDGERRQIEGREPIARAVVTDRYWLIAEGQAYELYAREDGEQHHDLAAGQRIPGDLLKRLESAEIQPPETTSEDEELVESLRALGYVD